MAELVVARDSSGTDPRRVSRPGSRSEPLAALEVVCRGPERRAPRRGLLAVMAGAAVLSAACGGGAVPPHVASLGRGSASGGHRAVSSGGNRAASSGARAPAGHATRLLNQWAACMRRHGDPGQADPTIDAGRVIHIIMAASVPGGFIGQDGQNGPGGPGSHCLADLYQASGLLRGHQPRPAPPSPAGWVKFGTCMRTHGIPAFPEGPAGLAPASGSAGRPGNVINNPDLPRASTICRRETGVDIPLGGPLPPGSFMSGPSASQEEPAIVSP